MLTKTQIEILKVFVSKITLKFSIKQVSGLLDKPYALIHRSIKPLIREDYFARDEKGFLSLNYKLHHQDLAYIESLRAKEFLDKKNNFDVKIFLKTVLESIQEDFFVLILFGSSVTEAKPKDRDILVLVDALDRVNSVEGRLLRAAEMRTSKFDIGVLSVESVFELFSKWEGKDVLNQTLNKHILLFGAENYYNLLKNARK